MELLGFRNFCLHKIYSACPVFNDILQNFSENLIVNVLAYRHGYKQELFKEKT